MVKFMFAVLYFFSTLSRPVEMSIVAGERFSYVNGAGQVMTVIALPSDREFDCIAHIYYGISPEPLQYWGRVRLDYYASIPEDDTMLPLVYCAPNTHPAQIQFLSHTKQMYNLMYLPTAPKPPLIIID